MHDVARGSLLETLLEIEHLSQAGVDVDGGRLPVAAIAARFADAFQFDPLRTISPGTSAVTIPVEQLPAASKALRELGVPFSNIGKAVSGSEVRLPEGTTVTECAEVRCEEDDLARPWALYPRS